jgi:FtsZ-binding cell division protein ZapB
MQQKEAKLEELYEQMSAVERERTRLRDTVINYEEENRNLVATLEESKIEVQELKKHIEIYENK